MCPSSVPSSRHLLVSEANCFRQKEKHSRIAFHSATAAVAAADDEDDDDDDDDAIIA